MKVYFSRKVRAVHAEQEGIPEKGNLVGGGPEVALQLLELAMLILHPLNPVLSIHKDRSNCVARICLPAMMPSLVRLILKVLVLLYCLDLPFAQ